MTRKKKLHKFRTEACIRASDISVCWLSHRCRTCRYRDSYWMSGQTHVKLFILVLSWLLARGTLQLATRGYKQSEGRNTDSHLGLGAVP